jgi:nitrite reductase/ring-hydroxylating ferredoxin subunit
MMVAAGPAHTRPTPASKVAPPNRTNRAWSLHPKAATRFAGRPAGKQSCPMALRRQHSLLPINLSTLILFRPPLPAACFFGKQEGATGKQPEADAPTAAAAVAAAMAAATTAEAGMLQKGLAAASEKPTATPADAYLWLERWYPVAVSEDLQPGRPHAISLFGQPLVLWWEGGVVADAGAAGGRWCCFRDCCPHRLAPLSEGRIDPATGQLVCSYHGWSFAGNGECTRVPQVGCSDWDGGACVCMRVHAHAHIGIRPLFLPAHANSACAAHSSAAAGPRWPQPGSRLRQPPRLRHSAAYHRGSRPGVGVA